MMTTQGHNESERPGATCKPCERDETWEGGKPGSLSVLPAIMSFSISSCRGGALSARVPTHTFRIWRSCQDAPRELSPSGRPVGQ